MTMWVMLLQYGATRLRCRRWRSLRSPPLAPGSKCRKGGRGETYFRLLFPRKKVGTEQVRGEAEQLAWPVSFPEFNRNQGHRHGLIHEGSPLDPRVRVRAA